jgi:PAS domain S-box-containing protein
MPESHLDPCVPRAAAGAFARYQRLQLYVGWSAEDELRVRSVSGIIAQRIPDLVEDFYKQLLLHPETAQVVTGGAAQLQRLRTSLAQWLEELVASHYDASYVERRWRIGLRHAEIGLHPTYASAAMGRLRNGIIGSLSDAQSLPTHELCHVVQSLNKLLDLDLMIIDDAYEAEHLRRETEAERLRSEVKFQRLVEAAACMVAILDPQGIVHYFSPYAAELARVEASEVLGKSFLDVLLPKEQRAAMQAELRATFEGQPTRGAETVLLRGDGTPCWLAWNGQRLDDYEGAPAVLVVGQDFSERREQHERMLRAERLAGIGQMTAGIAHESRNALQRIQSCTEMLELEINDNDEMMRLVHRIQEAQHTLHRLLDEVRGFAAPIQLEIARDNLSQVWRDAWNSLETVRRGRQATLHERTEGVELTMPVDRFQIGQLFRNLFENSLAACDDPVRIEIRCRNTQLGERSAVEVRIADNGPGLSGEVRAAIFEPFFTTKTKGTGLGMSIASRIAEAHGGSLEVDPTQLEGAAFLLTLMRNVP